MSPLTQMSRLKLKGNMSFFSLDGVKWSMGMFEEGLHPCRCDKSIVLWPRAGFGR